MASLEATRESVTGANEDYVRNLAALLYLRGLNHTEHFLLTTDLDGAGIFRNIVFVYSENGDVVACFIRLLEQSEEAQISDDFLGYFMSFKEILQSLPWLEQQFGAHVKNVEVVHYTDSQLSARYSASHPDHILDTGGLLLNLRSYDSPSEFFYELELYSEILIEFTSKAIDTSNFLPTIDRLIYAITSTEIKDRLILLKDNPELEVANKLILEIDGLVNKNKFKQFLGSLKVFHSQANPREMETAAQDEFLKVFGSDRDFLKDMDVIFREFINDVEIWMQRSDSFLTEDSNMWSVVVNKMVFYLSEPKRKEISEWGVHFNEESLSDLRISIEENRITHILSDSEDSSLCVLKVHQALSTENFLLIDMVTLLERPYEIMQIWGSLWCPTLVIESKEIDINEIKLMFSEVKKIMDREEPHTFIVISARGDKVAPVCLQELKSECWEYVDTSTLLDLSPPSQASLLSNQAECQGVSTSLSTLLHPYPELLERIRGNLLTYLLKSTSRLIIGHPLPPVMDDYFPRTLSRSTTLTKEMFHRVTGNTIIAISDSSPTKLTALLPFGEEPTEFNPVTDRNAMLCESSFLTLKDNVDEDILKELVDEEFTNLHCVQVTEDAIEWKWSKGDTKFLKEFINKDRVSYLRCDLSSDVQDEIVIVEGEAEIGKSTFINALARQTKQAYPSTWVVKIDLKVYSDYISNTLFDNQSAIVTLLEHIIGITDSKTTALDKLMFTQSLYRTGNIVVFVDGFELVPTYLIDKIAFMLKLLLENKIEAMYIACRPDIVEEIQDNFSALPYTLRAVDYEDQKGFLQNKWGKKLQDIQGLETFVNKVILLIKQSISDEERQMCCLPLQAIMVAENFQQELDTYITTGVISLSSRLNLISIVDKYVDKMCLTLLQNKRQSNDLDQHMLIQNKLSICDKYMTIALFQILSADVVECLDFHSLRHKYNKNVADLRTLSVSAGCLVNFTSSNPSFHHQFLLEYFAASQLVKEYVQMTEFINNRLLTADFKILRAWFDRVLSKDSELHCAVLNKDEEKLRSLFVNGADVNKVDDGGRTALHLAAMYDLSDTVKFLIRQGAEVQILDTILKWSPLRYADKLEAWGAIDMLIGTHSKTSDLIWTTEMLKNESLLSKVLVLSCREGYVGLIDFMYSSSVDVKQVIDFNGSTALHLASKYGKTDLVRYLVRYEAEVNKYGRQCRDILHSCLSVTSRLMTNLNANLNVLTNDGYTPLMLAAERGHKDTVSCLIQLGADVNLRKFDGCSAIHLAADGGYETTVKLLIESGAQINIQNNDGSSPLILAAKSGHTGILFHLLGKGANANFKDNEGFTALHWAARGGYADCIPWLLKCGAEVDQRTNEEYTALHWAAIEGHVDCVKCLIEAGADTEAINSDGASAVHLAAKMNNVSILMCLSAAGVNINVANSEKSTPLHWACKKGHRASVKCLIELGAKIDAINNKGLTPLHVAAWGGHANVVKTLIQSGASFDKEINKHSPVLHMAARQGHTDVLRVLNEAEADVNMLDSTGSTPLHWASWGGYCDTVDLLLKSGANVRLLDNNGSSAVHWASGEGKADVVRALIDAGATVGLANRDGDTPLHWAAKEGHVETAEVLVEAGADINNVNAEGSTPIHLAMMEPHGNMIEYLVKCGGDITC